ncbi:hypothetical protein I308_104451 [Cryptococcus tetragattii IND107]|uniref:Uncharacterized protein n=1 Tax=Cryptococcus tetragattii IND107 TaxID=1296105 RepID=A0ABR3BQE3_9TREE
MLSLMYEFAIAAQVPTSVVSVQAFRWGGRKESGPELWLDVLNDSKSCRAVTLLGPRHRLYKKRRATGRRPYM